MKGLGADRAYWDALEGGIVKMQQCAGCAKWNWPAVWRCGECGSWEHRWHEVEPKGRIFSWTRTWHDFGAPIELGLPFVSVVVELDGVDGKRLIGTLVNQDGEVKIGQPVMGEVHRVTFEGESIPALRWRLASGVASARETGDAR
ncbi:Zn-ribbon domain-containing OB-fold protein [Paraburkholderia bannensis]|uniref:Zn-ribbon domain-containing OB-fold protein n=1 Tax=Paraburkholderia bannensis TaxID=765414 RepID=UPI002AB68F0A|nr:OB-fold domain-containing protein [Paraburkholderia bannensis]